MKLIFRPIRKPAEEFAEVTKEPISRGMETYLEMHSFGFPDRPTPANLPVSVRLAATAKVIHERIGILSDILRRLENIGWDVHTEGDLVVVQNQLSLEDGWDVLRKEGISDHVMGLAERGSDKLAAGGPAGGGELPEQGLS
ncbi:MAG: hypothetical protein ACYCYK_03525 [Candidatus Dormibacteria bacterium]